MTKAQAQTVNALRYRRYTVHVVGRVKSGSILVEVQRRLHRGTLVLRIYSNGAYVAP